MIQPDANTILLMAQRSLTLLVEDLATAANSPATRPISIPDLLHARSHILAARDLLDIALGFPKLG